MPGPEVLTGRAERIPSLIAITLHEFVVWQRWGLLWPVALLAMVRIAREPELACWRPVALAVLMLLTAYGGIYLLSAWPDYRWHIITSMPRLLIPLAMLGVLLVAVALPPLSPRTRAGR